LARPRILTLNNETAEIQISTQTGHRLDPEHGGGGGTITQSTAEAEREYGCFSDVTRKRSLITGEILMAVKPQVKDVRTGGTFVQEAAPKHFWIRKPGNSIAFKRSKMATPLFWAGCHG